MIMNLLISKCKLISHCLTASLLNCLRLTVFDITGREVQTPVNESLNSWTYVTKLDAAQFASGIYFYKLSATSFTETKKMIL